MTCSQWIARVTMMVVLSSCGRCGGATSTTPGASSPAVQPIVGATTREALVEREPRFDEHRANATVDAAAINEIKAATGALRIDVVLGTWCGDSRREVGRFFRVLDEVAGPGAAAPLPFELRLIGVDHDKHAPEVTPELAIRYVPTFIVSRDGREVGRIVESAPRGLERELADLLAGTTSGVITGRAGMAVRRAPESDPLGKTN